MNDFGVGRMCRGINRSGHSKKVHFWFHSPLRSHLKGFFFSKKFLLKISFSSLYLDVIFEWDPGKSVSPSNFGTKFRIFQYFIWVCYSKLKILSNLRWKTRPDGTIKRIMSKNCPQNCWWFPGNKIVLISLQN